MSPIFLEKHKVGILEYITGGGKKRKERKGGKKPITTQNSQGTGSEKASLNEVPELNSNTIKLC